MGSCLSCLQHDDPDEYSSWNHSPTGASLVLENTQPDSLSGVLTSKECRMCLEEQTSDDDPVVQLGCMCLGDNGLAHESCIRKWFPRRLLETGSYDCEICKTQLGNHAISIFMQGLRPILYQYMFRQRINRVLQAIDNLENELALIFIPVLNRLSMPSDSRSNHNMILHLVRNFPC